MKYKLVIPIILFLSCTKTATYEPIIEQRTFLIYEFDSLIQTGSYELVITENDSSVVYKYQNNLDSTRIYMYRLNKLNNEILNGPFRYELAEQRSLNNLISFDRYEPMEYSLDGPEGMLFNKDFGVLASNNGWGYHFHFTSNKVNQIPIDQLLELLK